MRPISGRWLTIKMEKLEADGKAPVIGAPGSSPNSHAAIHADSRLGELSIQVGALVRIDGIAETMRKWTAAAPKAMDGPDCGSPPLRPLPSLRRA